MKKLRSTILLTIACLFGTSYVNAQCCSVITSNGVGVTTSNGICAVTASGAGDCGEATAEAIADKDNDGVKDADDKCPDVAGIVANKGCPAISENVKKALLTAAHIQFKTGSDEILPESYSNLDAVVKIMETSPFYKLELSGYTDNTGDATFNKELSKKRALAARQYLINKGVDVSRISAFGYGIENPVASNDTAEGRKENRRVEFKIKF